MKSHLFASSNLELEEDWSIFKNKILRVVVTPDRPVYTSKGAMIAYQGDRLEFNHHGGTKGLSGMMKKMVSSDDTPLMSVSGNAEVFFADMSQDIVIIYLENDGICVNGKNLLAFEAGLSYDLQINKGAGIVSGGLWSTAITGTGRVAIVSDGPTMLLNTSTPTYTDTDATVAWSSNLSPKLVSSTNFKSAIHGGSGEAMQYVFHGPGWVAVQPSELVKQNTQRQTNQNQSFNLGGLLGS